MIGKLCSRQEVLFSEWKILALFVLLHGMKKDGSYTEMLFGQILFFIFGATD